MSYPTAPFFIEKRGRVQLAALWPAAATGHPVASIDHFWK
jgi:hypothetical protein